MHLQGVNANIHGECGQQEREPSLSDGWMFDEFEYFIQRYGFACNIFDN